jgi:hypothetical protein
MTFERRKAMKKRLPLVLILIFLTAFFVGVGVVAAQDEETLVRLEIVNKSDQSAAMSLVSGNIVYYLAVPAGEEAIFTVERAVYTHTTFACGLSATGSVDILTQLKLVFTSCYRSAPNWGEPGLEKISIDDSPNGINWRYAYQAE